VIDTDRDTFDRAFRRVCGAFGKHLKADDLHDLSLTYFRILESHPLDRVLLAAKACISTSKKFPLAADWLAALLADRPVAAPADVRTMTIDEIDERADAEAARYDGQPCLCRDCVRANVDDRALRYVPDDDERAFNTRRNTVQTPGHWAHGEELARWYDARERFYRCAPRRLRRALALMAAREPGEEG
jgi:hypothetical protein